MEPDTSRGVAINEHSLPSRYTVRCLEVPASAYVELPFKVLDLFFGPPERLGGEDI